MAKVISISVKEKDISFIEQLKSLDDLEDPDFSRMVMRSIKSYIIKCDELPLIDIPTLRSILQADPDKRNTLEEYIKRVNLLLRE